MAAIFIPHLRLKLDFIYQKHPFINNNQQLADAMGLKASNISQWRHGLRENLIPEKRVLVLCDVLGVDKQILLAEDINQFYQNHQHGVDQSCPYEFSVHTFAQYFDQLQQLFKERAPTLLAELKLKQKVLECYYQTPWQALSSEAKKEFSQTFYRLDSLCQKVINVSLQEFLAGTIVPKYDSRCPFPGLYAFNDNQADFFFGRDDNIKSIVKHLQQHRRAILIGPSGCGKSSIALAGILPYLQTYYKTLNHLVMSPGQTPDTTLKTLFNSDHAKQKYPYLIIIDQLEELFSLSKEAQREAFISHLNALLDCKDFNIYLLATLRSDFLEPCFSYPKLIQLLSHDQILIKPLNADFLLGVIEKQANSVGLIIESRILESLKHELNRQLNAMPLVQHLLYQLWLRRINRNLHYLSYQSLGGLLKAIATSADDFYNALEDSDKKRCQQLFIRLTHLGQYQSDYIVNTKNRIDIDQLANDNEFIPLLEKMVRQRLLIIQENANKKTIEVSHEALLQHWPRLKQWLIENQEALLVHNQIASFAVEWNAKNKDPALLLEIKRLTKMNHAIEIYGLSLNQIEQEFINASIKQQEYESNQTKQKNLRISRNLKLRNYALAGLGLITFLLFLLSTGFAIQSYNYEQQSIKAHSNAEQLMTYMVDDLVIQLEKVGRLDVLSNTIKQIDDYFDKTTELTFSIEQTTQKLNLLHSTGYLKKKLGQLEQSINTYKTMEYVAKEALNRFQNHKNLHLLLASAYFGQAQILLDKKEFIAANENFKLQKSSAERALKIWPDDKDLLQEIATALHNLGVVAYQNTQLNLAISLFNQALDNKKNLLDNENSISIVQRQTLANTHALLGTLYRETSNYKLSKLQLDLAEQLLLLCLSIEPKNTKLKAQLIRLFQSKGNLFAAQKQVDNAIEIYQIALSEIESVIDQNSQDATLHSLRAVIALSIGKMLNKKKLETQSVAILDRYYGKFYDYLINHNNDEYTIDQYSLSMLTQITLTLSITYQNINQPMLAMNPLIRSKALLQNIKRSNTDPFITQINARINSINN